MLRGLSWLYGKIIESRNSLYTRGTLKSEALPAPTISVGNITVGGTGKTPLVAYIAELLHEKGETVCVISRGYRREKPSDRVLVSDGKNVLSTPALGGDEPFELAMRLSGKAIVVSDKNRLDAARWAHKEFGVTAFVLDDAFQHRRARRDLDIVVIDSTNPFGNERTVPSGILREPVGNLRRADAIVLSRTDLSPDSDRLIERVNDIAPQAHLFAASNAILGFSGIEDFHGGSESTKKDLPGPFLAFCGLGNPDSFVGQLVDGDYDVVASEFFSDHHRYSSKDIGRLESKAVKTGARALVTTAKDAVKLDPAGLGMPCFVCEISMVLEDEKGFDDLVAKALANRSV